MTHIFTDEQITIDPFVDNYFEKKIVPILPKMKNYKIVKDGAISAGKSTGLEYLYMLFKKYGANIAVLQEYINSDKEIGPKFLGRFISKDITNATFQNYILDTYKSTYNNIIKQNPDYNIMMMERVPDDSILIFANITNRNSPEDLNEQTLFALYNKMNQYNKECDFPSYSDPETKFVEFVGAVDDIMINIIDTIVDDIENGITKRIIGLSVNTDVCISRIKRRGRKEEQNYDKAYLAQIIHSYNEIFRIKRLNEEAKKEISSKNMSEEEKMKEYKEIDKKYNIRFTNIGRLIDNF